MSNSNHRIRRIVASHWLTTLGMCLVAALAYWPACAQDRGPAKPAAASSGAADNGPAQADGGINPNRKKEILANADSDIGTADAVKKDTPPVKEADTASIFNDIKWLSPHMWAFYAIWLVSLIAVSFAVERFVGLRRSRIMPADLAAGLRAAASRKGEFDLRHAQRLCKQYPSSAATVVRAMLAKAGRPLPEIEKAMTETLEHEATRQYANVRVQALAFNVAPMLGLAGTVHGIIICFYSLAHMQVGQNKMDALATGIYAALICTLAGLVVAIPAGILSHYFEGRIMRMFQKVEDVTRSLVPLLEPYEGRPRLAVIDEKPARPPSIIEMSRDDFDDDDAPLPAPKAPPRTKKIEGDRKWP
jgi:biopolymer transport protein ExbB